MSPFVKPESIVRTIWSDTDCILFIFGACAGEFAHSKSVDWLFYTGKLPNDPIGRLFSTVVYSQQIIFNENAQNTIQTMTKIHRKVEAKRGFCIPNWAYQDVLYMLIDYTARVYELLHRPLAHSEKEEIYDVFRRIGTQMEIQDLPTTWDNWQINRTQHLERNYSDSELTQELFRRYKTHLGAFRYTLLLIVQSFLLPKQFLKTSKNWFWTVLLQCYKYTKSIWPIRELKYYLLPQKHQKSLRDLAIKKPRGRCPFSNFSKKTEVVTVVYT